MCQAVTRTVRRTVNNVIHDPIGTIASVGTAIGLGRSNSGPTNPSTVDRGAAVPQNTTPETLTPTPPTNPSPDTDPNPPRTIEIPEPTPPTPPEPVAAPVAAPLPNFADPTAIETAAMKRKKLSAYRYGLSQTIKTSALGLPGPAPIAAPTAASGLGTGLGTGLKTKLGQ